MPKTQLRDSKSLYQALAKSAFEQGDYAKCFEFASKLGNLLPADFREMVAYSAYMVGLELAAKGDFQKAGEKIRYAQAHTSNPVLRALCNQRYELGKGVSYQVPMRESQCPICTDNRLLQIARGLSEEDLRPEVDNVYCIAAYRSGWDRQKSNPFSKALRTMKEPDKRKTVEAMGKLMAHFISFHLASSVRQNTDLLVAVPTVPERYAKRGYAIPEVLADKVSRQTSIPMYPKLITLNRATSDLRHLSKADRQRELTNAFTVTQPDMVKGLSVMIVDDITTHGTTLKEIGRTLHEAGAREVAGLVLAHTESSWI